MKEKLFKSGLTPRVRLFFSVFQFVITIFWGIVIANISTMQQITYNGHVFTRGEAAFSEVERLFYIVLSSMVLFSFVIGILMFRSSVHDLRNPRHKCVTFESLEKDREPILEYSKRSSDWRFRAFMAGMGIHFIIVVLLTLIIVFFDLGNSLGSIIPLYMFWGWFPLIHILRPLFLKHLR